MLLQLSSVNSYARDFSNKEIGVSNIEFSETGKLNTAFSKVDFNGNNIFEASFLDVVSCRSVSYCEGYAEFMTEAGEQASKAKAAALTLKKMSNNWYELTNGGWELYRFEGSIPDIETGHKLDALLRRTNPETGLYEYKSLEMKNWSSARSMPANKGSQFYAYIESGHKFEYYFPDGISDAMKSNFQNIFKDATKAEELWDLNSSFFRNLGDGEITSLDKLIKAANDGKLVDLINWVK